MSKQKKLTVFVQQMNSVDSYEENQKSILDTLTSISAQPEPQFVSFPENCLYLRIKEQEAIPAVTLQDKVFVPFREMAKSRNLWIHFGSVPITDGQTSKALNATIIIDPKGNISSPYQKIHLFDVDVEGLPPIRESDAFAPGREPHIVEIGGWRIGLSICYDLRFPELYHLYRKQGVDIILVPSAFTVPTGQAHWEVLLRARAIESQCYVIAAAQGGTHKSVKEGTRKTFGHSMIVGPWGEVLAEGKTDPVLLSATLAVDEIQRVREQIPISRHSRL